MYPEMFTFIFALHLVLVQSTLNMDDANLNFTEIARKYGREVEEHDVVTEDGYILKVFHVVGNRKNPVLLMHGLIDSADTFIIRGRRSLVLFLAENNYDVWVGNARGNKYSRRHKTLDPDDKKFWDFGMHEIGVYDVPASIDYVLNASGQSKLSAVGHSQGTTVFYIMGSMRPDYNDKINVLVALAPISFLDHLKPPLPFLVKISGLLNDFLSIMNIEEVLSEKGIINNIIRVSCSGEEQYDICVKCVFFLLAGDDSDEFEPEFLPVVIGHYPTSTSRKNVEHLSQVARAHRFAQYDYGARNIDIYNSTTNPEYDLSKLTMKVALYVGVNDKLSTVEDVAFLRRRLPNVVQYHEMENKMFNHIDFVWGRNMTQYLFPTLHQDLQKYKYVIV